MPPTTMTDETLEDLRKRETELLVRRRFEVSELFYEKVLTTGDPKLAKAFLDATTPMVKEAEKPDPLAGLPKVAISIHYGSVTLGGEVTPIAPEPEVIDMEPAQEALPPPEPLPTLDPMPAPNVIDADTLARLLAD